MAPAIEAGPARPPPGCGKTTAARAIAGELRLPMIGVRMDLACSGHPGETPAALTDISAEAARVRGIYLFDEFSALGRTRPDGNDAGEMKRVVTHLRPAARRR